MKQGLLSDYFSSVAMKTLSAVEADVTSSNQHEFNGVSMLKQIFGKDDLAQMPAKFVWLSHENESAVDDGFLTWYDARRNHPRRSEYRLYFPTTAVSEMASAGDTLFIARRADGSVLVIVTPPTSSIRSQLIWLFGLTEQQTLNFETKHIDNDHDAALNFAARFILDEIGVEYEDIETSLIDDIIEKFDLVFPNTKIMSETARRSLSQVSPNDNPDAALLAWLEREEQLFRRLERKIVSERLQKGFKSENGADVDGFLKFSLSVQNRRKSRMGAALENHLEAIFSARKIAYVRNAVTERKSRPDFLFPGQAEYNLTNFPAEKLFMLGAKSTCKDRWRQVLQEADRIPNKHLLTLEPSISTTQTSEMIASELQLVIPQSLHQTYKESQQNWLLSLSEFIELVSSS